MKIERTYPRALLSLLFVSALSHTRAVAQILEEAPPSHKDSTTADSAANIGAQATLYAVGDLPGGAVFSEVRDVTRVNGVLYAVGDTSANAGSTSGDTAFLWTKGLGMSPLPNLVGNMAATNAIIASAITPDGAYIASRARADTGVPNSQRHAVRVTRSTLTNLDLGTLPGFPQTSVATSISSNGSVLYGFARYNSAGLSQAVRYTATGPTITAIPFLNAGDDTSTPAGRGTSSDGSVMVGTSTNSVVDGGDSSGTGNAAFRYVQGVGVSAIPFLSGGTWSVGLGVSPDGKLALVTGNSPSAPQGEFYVYNAATGSTTALGTPNGGMHANTFSGMTADGSIVAVSMYNDVADGGYIHNSSGWHEIRALAARAGADVTGWSVMVCNGISADGTLVWGNGQHNGSTEGWILDFASGYLAIATEPTTFSTPGKAIVGAWTFGDTSTTSGSVFIFFASGYYVHIQTALASDAPGGVSGFERGQYTWNASTGSFLATSLLDTNGDIGLSGSGTKISISIVGDTLTAAVQGGTTQIGTRITSSVPLVGAFYSGDPSVGDKFAAVVFLPNGFYYFAEDGDSTPAGDPSGKDGMERGTYTWNASTGAFTATALQDTNGQWGLSNLSGAQTLRVSPDLNTLTVTSGRTLARVVAPAVSMISAQPQGHVIAAGGTVVLGVGLNGEITTSPIHADASSSGGIKAKAITATYQWNRNGVAIPGATFSQLLISGAQASDAASYTVTVTNSSGTVTSNPAVLSVVTTSDPGRLINVSVRITSGVGEQVLLVGFVTSGGSSNKNLLIRGIGPTLTGFGVPSALADPLLEVIPQGASTALVSNDNWSGDATVISTANAVGAFTLPDATSKDSALLASLPAGLYSVKVSGKNNTTGTTLAEIYDGSPSVYGGVTPELINVSARAQSSNDNPLIAGFVVGGSTAKTFLIRAVGPTLGAFGVGGAMANPIVEIFHAVSGTQQLVASNDNWAGSPVAINVNNLAGAFQMATGASNDAIVIVTLDPGVYSAKVTSTNNVSGIALVEVYALP